MTIIKKVKFHGFKSFAKPTEILFENGFNTIIGPNGSGKSNIMDGLCFVLGKTSAKSMRAEKSANLIYNGGKKGSPSKQASIAIVFDNKTKQFPINSNEIQITRIVKQNGISVYKINDEKRSRQDVIDLLSTAKINPDGHNIVLQGDIVRFMEMRPDDRRELVEEISGISVYEDKKEKALHELDKVQVKLSEAEIILTERGTYLKELKKDRDQAVKYKDLEKKIKSNKGTFIYRQLKEKSEKKKELEEKIKSQQDKINKIKEDIVKIKNEINNKKNQIKEINDTIEKRGGALTVQKDFEITKIEYIKNTTRLDVCNNETEKIKNREKQLQNHIKELVKKIEDLNNKKLSLTKTKKDFKHLENLKDQKNGLKEITDKINKYQIDNNSISVQLEKARNNLIEENRKLAELNAVKLSFKEDIFQSGAIKEIFKINGVHGTVSDLGKVSSEYATALQVAAGSRLKHIVVDTDKIAEECIKILKDRKLGVATFLPLNKIKPKIIKEEIKEVTKVAGVHDLAINLIKYNKKYDNVFSYIFGSTLVIDNIQTARKIGIGRVRMVSLEGDLIEESGAMVGGYRKKLPGQGFKEVELDKKVEGLDSEIAKLKQLISTLEKRRIENDNLTLELRDKKSELEKEIMGQEQKLEIENVSEFKNIETEINFHLQEKSETEGVLKQNKKELEDFQNEIKVLNEKIKKQKTSLKDYEGREKDFLDKFKNLNQSRNKFNEEIQNKEMLIVKEEEKIINLQEKINDVSIDKAKVTAEIEGLEKGFEEFKETKIRQNIDNELLKKEIEDFEKVLKNISNVNFRALEVYEEVEKEYNKILGKTNKLKEEKDSVLNMINEIEQEKTGIFMKTFNVLNKNFKKIFSELTTKGEAMLEPENEEEPLKEGLDIKVRLTGNKFLDIRSLSGGEKTLAALAFIFAIQEHQPGSFYLLDEVDAALDKRNSEKLSHLIRKYSEKAQYIMVSHNDAIISEANTIYGVSMKEDGVSKIVSLKI